MTNHWIDLQHCKTILVEGSNVAENHPMAFKWIRKAQENGAKIIHVDPRFTRTSAAADMYARIRPGTDAALLNTIINYVLVHKDVVNYGVEKRSVGTGTNARVHVGRRRCPGESRVDVDDLRPVFLGLPDPLEGHGMVLCHIAALHQNRLAMLEVNPVVGHRPPPERSPQTGDRRAVSESGLVLDESGAEQARRFLEEVALLVGVLCAAHEGDRIRPVDRNLRVAEFLGGDPRRVAGLSNLLRDSFHRVFPRDILPSVAARCPVTRRAKPVRRGVSREHGYAFNAQGSAVHDVVVVAFHGNELAFAYGGDHAAPARAEVARGSELIDVFEL